MATRSAPAAAHPRRNRVPITRDIVLRAALEIVDDEGLEALTMRRLGRRLDRDPMALYRYAANREALLDGVAEVILDQLVVPTDTADWAGQLRASAHDFRRLALAHPHVVPLLVTRPLRTPLGLRPLGTLRPLEQVLTLLMRAGFTPHEAARGYRAYFGFLYGHILTELQEVVSNPEESDDLLRLGLYRLPPHEFPVLRALATELAHVDGRAELDRGLDTLLTGFEPTARSSGSTDRAHVLADASDIQEPEPTTP